MRLKLVQAYCVLLQPAQQPAWLTVTISLLLSWSGHGMVTSDHLTRFTRCCCLACLTAAGFWPGQPGQHLLHELSAAMPDAHSTAGRAVPEQPELGKQQRRAAAVRSCGSNAGPHQACTDVTWCCAAKVACAQPEADQPQVCGSSRRSSAAPMPQRSTVCVASVAVSYAALAAALVQCFFLISAACILAAERLLQLGTLNDRCG